MSSHSTERRVTAAGPRVGRLHYGWIVALVTFVVLLTTAGIRATPGILIVPLEGEFHWSRTAISTAIAINIALFGLIGPFAASVMDRWGLRRVVLAAIALVAAAVALTTQMREQWQLMLLWGVLVGSGTGVTSLVLAAIVATRWFDERRGLVIGALSAANATGQLIFLPVLARLVDGYGWRAACLAVAAAAIVVFTLVLLLMRDRPQDVGLRRYGERDTPGQIASSTPALPPLEALKLATRSRAFWVLAGTFFICGASTNGLIGTHLIAACHDYGISQVRSAQLLAMMGIFDIAGTTASGWLTDRYSSRHLLFAYYTLRGISLLFLPLTLASDATGLGWFAVFYGLDWVATVPPTVRLTGEAFGRENTGVVYGWIAASHQLGASLAALGAGAIRTSLGDYSIAFWIAGTLCALAGLSFLTVGRRTFRHRDAQPLPAMVSA
ncbi:MAG TPA: MFS transporter [Vicinamibacterales bacterium]|nr:MFS transporter [Vicinamibacterales bacterium]